MQIIYIVSVEAFHMLVQLCGKPNKHNIRGIILKKGLNRF